MDMAFTIINHSLLDELLHSLAHYLVHSLAHHFGPSLFIDKWDTKFNGLSKKGDSHFTRNFVKIAI